MKLVAQDPASGRHGLGELAFKLGLAAIADSEVVRIVQHKANELLARLGFRVTMAG